MYINYFNAVEDSLDLAAAIPPDTDCQPVGTGYTVPPACEPYIMAQCPPCSSQGSGGGAGGSQPAVRNKMWNIFWIVVAGTLVLSLCMGGEDDSLTGGPVP